MQIAKKISSLIAISLLTTTFNSNSMKRQQQPPTTILPKEMQDQIITELLNRETTASTLQETGKAINSLAQVNHQWNKKINDPDLCLQLIKRLSTKFNCSDGVAAAALQTKAANERLELQRQFLHLITLPPNKSYRHILQGVNLSFTHRTEQKPLPAVMIAMQKHTFPNIVNIIGNTPQDYNAINQTDSAGNTLLLMFLNQIQETISYVFKSSNISTIEWLLEHGADPERPNFAGVTPLQLAQEIGNQEVIDLIQNAIAKKHAQ